MSSRWIRQSYSNNANRPGLLFICVCNLSEVGVLLCLTTPVPDGEGHRDSRLTALPARTKPQREQVGGSESESRGIMAKSIASNINI
jgi:hypothetical protein